MTDVSLTNADAVKLTFQLDFSPATHRRLGLSLDTYNVMHGYFYHGFVDRSGAIMPSIQHLCVGDEPMTPLTLMRSATVVPDFVFPEECCLVTPRVQRILTDLPNIGFLPVQIRKWTDRWVSIGEIVPSGVRPRNMRWIFLRDRECAPPDAEQPYYYEVIPFCYDRIPEDLRAGGMLCGSPHRLEGDFEQPWSRELLKQYPIVHPARGYGLVFSAAAWQLIKEFIDPLFLEATPLRLVEAGAG